MKPNEIETEIAGIVNSSFVRESFYVQPPMNQNPAEWVSWLEADKKEAIKAKRAHTSSLVKGEIPESLKPQAITKIGGVWKQSVSVGLVGSEESFSFEPIVEAEQEKIVEAKQEAAETIKLSKKKSGNQRRKGKR